MPRVNLPDGRVVNFPAGMPMDQIQAEVAKLAGPDPHIVNGRRVSDHSIPDDQQPPLPSYMESVKDYATGELAGAGKAFVGMINPMTYAPYVKDLAMPGGALRAGYHLGKDTVEGVANTARGIFSGDPEAMGGALLTAAAMAGPGASGLGLPKLPPTAGRIFSAGWNGLKAGAAKVPVVGPPMRAAIKGMRQSWADSAPAAAEAAAPTAYPMPSGPAFEPQATQMPQQAPRIVPEGAGPAPQRPHLNSQQVAQMLRDQYGSEEASRMLYGRSQPGALRRPDAQAAIKRLAPGESHLPEAAKRSIDQGVQSADWDYVQGAPNDLARQYLLSLMRGK